MNRRSFLPSSKKAILEAAKKRAGKLEAKGKAVNFDELLRMEPDGGTTNVRNTASAHWKPWLGPSNRCVVPLTSFSEFDHVAKQDVWFALSLAGCGVERYCAMLDGPAMAA